VDTFKVPERPELAIPYMFRKQAGSCAIISGWNADIAYFVVLPGSKQLAVVQ
jgi:hypothetical protein